MRDATPSVEGVVFYDAFPRYLGGAGLGSLDFTEVSAQIPMIAARVESPE
jgi:hypothetical protein